MRAVPRLCEFYPGICLTTEGKKHGKTSVRVRKTSVRLRKTSVRLRKTSVRVRKTSVRLRKTSVRVRKTSVRLRKTSVSVSLFWGESDAPLAHVRCAYRRTSCGVRHLEKNKETDCQTLSAPVKESSRRD